MLIQGDMPSLLNHNMKGGSRHKTNEFSQNVSLTFFLVIFIIMCKILFMKVIEKLNHITDNTWHISEWSRNKLI